MPNRTLWTSCGAAGVAGVACYLAAIFVPWPETQWGTSLALLCVSGWPVFSVVYAYGMYNYVAAEREGAANRLSLIFIAMAFTTVLSMIVVQLAVGAALPEITPGLDDTTARALRRGLRMIDMGMDVAWDMLLGSGLIFLGWAIRRRSGYGPIWGVPAMILGAALILLNSATFPWPPADRGLFDIGPFIGLYILLQAGRLYFLGRKSVS